jgi:AcrR family transcriptional regulator
MRQKYHHLSHGDRICGVEAPVTDTTAERILDATVIEAAAQGLRRVTMDGVARRAGVNRMTIYRHFKDRDALVAAMVARDTQRMVSLFLRALAANDAPLDGFVEGVWRLLRFAREHPFITRAARLEPGYLVEAGMSDDAAMLRRAVMVGATAIRGATAGQHLALSPEELAETVARLLVSYVLLPTTVAVDLDDEHAARGYVRAVLTSLLTAAS